eukprot:SAG11_NODE_10551_length_822_cov_1.764869_1_plen_39_part_10
MLAASTPVLTVATLGSPRLRRAAHVGQRPPPPPPPPPPP